MLKSLRKIITYRIIRLTTKGIFWHFSVQLSCGGTSSENCTYFQSDGNEIGQCRIKICPCSENICQLRLDFSTFVITGPETVTTTVVVNKIGGKSFHELGQCQTDIFSVTAPGNNAPGVICGTNSGEHSKLRTKIKIIYN